MNLCYLIKKTKQKPTNKLKPKQKPNKQQNTYTHTKTNTKHPNFKFTGPDFDLFSAQECLGLLA